MVNIAAARRMTATAEGVETVQQQELLALGCAPKCRVICSVRQSRRLTSSSYFSRSTSNRTREPGAKAPVCSRQRLRLSSQLPSSETASPH